MSIDTGQVTNAVLAVLREAQPDFPVGDGRIPANAGGGAYAVLDVEPGGISDGDMDQPERDVHIRYRVTAVSRDPAGAASADGARLQAEHLAWRFHSALMDRTVPITDFDEWTVAGREHIASGGAIREGTVVSVVNDYALWVVTTETVLESP